VPDSNRSGQPSTLNGIVAAVGIVLALALAWGLGALQGSEDERRDQTPASYAQAAKADAKRACAGRKQDAVFECVYEKVEAGQEQARGEQDLSAQQRAASANLISALMAFLTLVVSGIALWFLKGTLEATRDAVAEAGDGTKAALVAAQAGREANAIARAGNRPIMAFAGFEIEHWGKPPEQPVSPDNAQALVVPVWKNVGPMPALPVACPVYRSYVEGNPSPEDIEALREKGAAQTQHEGDIIPANGLYKGPGVMLMGRQLGVREHDLRAVALGLPPLTARNFALIIARLEYKAAIGPSEEWVTEKIEAILPLYGPQGFRMDTMNVGPIWERPRTLHMT
jgi:hypothetical protein